MEERPPIKRIGVVVRPNLPEALPVIQQMTDWLQERRIEVLIDGELAPLLRRVTSVDESKLVDQIDLLVVLGGDGTMLGAARMVGARKIPVLGINFGRLGYLTDFTLEELFPALDYVLSGHFVTEPRTMLSVCALRDGQVVSDDQVLNDVVVTKGTVVRMIEIDCWIDSHFVNLFRADGLIIATPTGSTAYNLSAGGPIIYPVMGALVLTPICPHTLSNRPLLLPDTAVVELCLHSHSDEATVTLDGQKRIPLQSDDRILITKSDGIFHLVRPLSRNYFQVLRSKLKWGAQ
ncbi:MAG TPA: NAD(+)/NADH kinase [Blastocatellia bacterium]|nr:NAD(+)/NADH kinase [Blastocatellia bacterium]